MFQKDGYSTILCAEFTNMQNNTICLKDPMNGEKEKRAHENANAQTGFLAGVEEQDTTGKVWGLLTGVLTSIS